MQRRGGMWGVSFILIFSGMIVSEFHSLALTPFQIVGSGACLSRFCVFYQSISAGSLVFMSGRFVLKRSVCVVVAILGLFAPMAALSQMADAEPPTIRLEGRVAAEEDDAPMPGAIVRVARLVRDSTGKRTPVATERGAVVRTDGSFVIDDVPADTLLVTTSHVGYHDVPMEWTPGDGRLLVFMQVRPAIARPVIVSAIRRSRTVEDACCRVESLQEEVQQHAPFSPSAGEVLARYSSCTSTKIHCSVDGSSFIRLRGLEPTSIRLLLDGVPAFTGLGTLYGLDLVPSTAIQTIKITEGASSVRHGNGALSGTVDLVTRIPTEVPEFIASTTINGGPDGIGHTDVSAGYTGLIGEAGVAAFGTFRSGAETTDGDIEHNDRRGSFFLKGNLLIDDATELTLSGLGGWDRRRGTIRNHLGDVTDTIASDYNESVDIERLDLDVRLARNLTTESEITAVFHLASTSLVGDYGLQQIDVDQQSLYASLIYTASLGSDHVVTAGGEIQHDKTTETGNAGLAWELSIPAVMIEDQWSFATDWTLLGSLRYDHHSLSGAIVTPRSALRFAPDAATTMRLMAGWGFKGEALANESHGVLHGLYRWRANPAFEGERSFTVNYDITHRLLLGESVAVDANLNAYHTTISGRATPDADSLAGDVLFFVNSPRSTRLRGMEFQVRPSINEHWSGSFAVALIDYSQEQTDGSYKRVALAPSLNIDLSLLYESAEAGITAELWGSHIGEQTLPLNPSGVTTSPSYTLLNLRAEKKFGPVALYLGARNLLDLRQSTTTPLAFPNGNHSTDTGVIWGPIEGREFFAGVRFVWMGDEPQL